MILYMYIAQEKGQKTPWGQTFEVNRKPLSLRPFVASFKQTSLNSDFIHIFLCFSTCLATGQGQDNPLGSEFLCKHIPHVTLVICFEFLPLNDFLTVFPI